MSEHFSKKYMTKLIQCYSFIARNLFDFEFPLTFEKKSKLYIQQ